MAGTGSGRSEMSPTFRDRSVHPNDAIRERVDRSTQPALECPRGGRIPSSNSLHSAPQLTNGQDAEKEVLGLPFPEPADDVRICPITLPELGQYVRVQ